MFAHKRPRSERGETRTSWLQSWHSFSFGGYVDPRHEGFRALRVINEDIVAPGAGFGTHPHRNAEIITYVVSGELQHHDSMGHGAVISAGSLQYMSAGSGVTHSEYNPSSEVPVHFLQIWILPSLSGGEPRYEQRDAEQMAARSRSDRTLVCSPDGREGSIAIRQDAYLYLMQSSLADGAASEFSIDPGRFGWFQVVTGAVKIGSEELVAGDGLGVQGGESLSLAFPNSSSADKEKAGTLVLAFDLP